jgi:acyl carrier protein/D-alanine--poly(phosphoribitol) ligase subunit 2
MLPADVEASVRSFLARETRLPAASIGPDTALVSSGLLDSVGLVRLATLLERRLGIRIPDRDVTVEHFDTLGRMAAYVERRTSR